METGALYCILRGHIHAVFSVAFSPKGDWIASGCGSGEVRLWKIESGEWQHVLLEHTSWVLCVAFSPERDMVASGGFDNTVRIW
jgi:WD40 repeat protein